MKNMFIYVAVIIVLIVSGSALSENLDKLQRSKGKNSPECSEFYSEKFTYPIQNSENRLNSENSWKCFDQKIRISGTNIDFSMNFLEFHEDGSFRNEAQFRSLLEKLGKGDHLVVVYVHGWRHDAGKNDGDVNKFRTMLAYSNQFLAERRNKKESSYKNHQLTGVYIAWPGRGRFDCKFFFCNLTVAPSLFGRKETSDVLGKKVVSKLQKIYAVLNERGDRSKMLVTGHSLGGNILIRGIRDAGIIKNLLSKHKGGQKIESSIGDLTVLFNPASEAMNWIDIQKQVREKMGLINPNVRYGKNTNEAVNSHKYFSKLQKPILLSLTSACDWPDFVTKSEYNKDLGNRKIECDSATGKLFPVFRKISGDRGDLEKIAIGHLEPSDKCEFYNPKSDPKCPIPMGHALSSFGTTHELEVNVLGGGAEIGRATTLKNASDPLTSKCEIGDGWLAAAKSDIQPISPNRIGWDAGYKIETARNWINRYIRINAQFRHGIYRGFGKHGRVGDYYITTANDPFWNVRALDTAVKKHGGFHSYPTWCAIHQLVLDDVTKE